MHSFVETEIKIRTFCGLEDLESLQAKYIRYVRGLPRSHTSHLGPNLLSCCCPHRTSVHTHTHTLNKWLGPPPWGQRSRRWPVHQIYHGSSLRSAPLDPVQHLFSHQGTLCWRGVATPLCRLALPSWVSREDEVL